MDRIDGVDPAESPATSGWATPTLFGNAEEATQYYAVHGPPCQLWDGLALQAVLQQHEQKAVQGGGEDTPTYLGTFEQSQRLWEASGCPVAEPLLPPPEIERVVNFVANQRNQREALRAQHEQLLLALEPVVADQTAEEPAEEAADVVEEVYEQALEHVDYQKNPEAVAPQTENLEAPKAETASVAVVESIPSPDSELLSCGLALDNLNTNAPKFRPGMEVRSTDCVRWHVWYVWHVWHVWH